MRVSVVGLGKLGAPMAAVFAARGHEVIGLDLNPAFVAALEAGRSPVDEPRLQEMIDAGRSRLRATSNYDELVRKSDVTFMIVPTPSDRSGAFTNDYVIAAVEALGKALRGKDGYHVVVVTSTVMPGSTGGLIREALERTSGRRVGEDLGLCYNPEFIALGSVIANMLEPDFLLVGESDPQAGQLVASVYDAVCEKHPPVHRMNFVNAELTKISVNTFITTKISYANMLADLCDRLPGADADVVSAAVGADSRIGRKYLRSAIGYGGPCFPRDNVAFGVLADRLGARADIARATDALNRYQIERLMHAVTSRVAAGARIALLGMSYKPDTAVIEESQGIALARNLAASGYSVTIHDPKALDAAKAALGAEFAAATTAAEALSGADAAVVLTPWPEYAGLDGAAFKRKIPVIDCWRILPRETLGQHARIVWLGYHEQELLAAAT